MVLVAIPVVGLVLAAISVSCVPFVHWIPALGPSLAAVFTALAA